MSENKKNEKSNNINFVDQRISKRKDILSEEIDDEIVLFDPKNRNTYALNQMGSIIWQLCDGEHTPYEISNEISSTLGENSDQVLADVLKVISDLLDKELVEAS